MILSCTSDKNWDILNYERYLTIALAIGNDNPYSFACFSVLNEAQQNLLISQTIAQGLTSVSQPRYWGSFWSNEDQVALNINEEKAVTLEETDPDSDGVSINSNSQITFANAGVYSVTFSVQWTNTHVQIHDSNIWLKKNGDVVPSTNSRFSIIESHGGVDGHVIGTVNYALRLDANDYLELYWSTSDLRVSMQHIPEVSPHPETPSIILTATQVAI
jgi:hypothetical protein